MKHWLYKMSLQKKMLYSYGLLFIISLSALLIFFFRGFRQERATELTHMTQYNGQMELSLDTMIADTDSFRHMQFSDDRIRSLLFSDDSDIFPENHKAAEEQLTRQLTLLADMGNYVLRAMVVTADGRVYKSVAGDDTRYLREMDALTEDIAWEKDTPAYFSEVHREVISLVGYRVVSMVSPMWNVVGETPIATVYLDLDFNKIANQWHRSAAVGQSSDFMILSPSQVLFDSGESDSGAALEENTYYRTVAKILESEDREGLLTLRGKRCVVSVGKNDSTGWYLVQYLPTAVLAGRIMGNMSVILIILAAVIIATAAGSYILSRQVSRPVKVLSRVMGQVARDSKEEQEIPLFAENEILWEDEVGQMIHSYNSMAGRINDNIIKMYVYRLNQKQTELKMLQFQINPHFLYNALNTISAIAKLEDVRYIPEIADSLSDMFRYNISGRDIVTIREELEQTEHYMSIQKIRFPERFETCYEVEEGLGESRILKFVLQPVVENAYKYGFSKKRQKDVLRLRVFREGARDIVLSVEDDGIGIGPDKVQSMNASFERAELSKTSHGIGLSNVNARLKNYYGDGCGIRVESEPGHYTKVYLRIKAMAIPEESGGTENDPDCGGGR